MSSTDGSRPVASLADLPDTVDLAAVDAAEMALIRLACDGGIDPRTALCFSRMLEHRRRAVGDRTLEEKMRRLEAQWRGDDPDADGPP